LRACHEKECAEAQSFASEALEKQKVLQADLKKKQERLLDAYMERLLERDEYARQRNKLHKADTDILNRIRALRKNSPYWLEPLEKWIKSLETLGKIASLGTVCEKRVLAPKSSARTWFLSTKKPLDWP
jgi:hypothetical protein